VAKSAVARPWQRQFLGYSMRWHPKPKLRRAAASAEKLTKKVQALLQGARGRNLGATIQTLSCAGGRPTSSGPKPSGHWKSAMDGYGISYAASCGGNGSGPIGEHSTLMPRGLTPARAWRSATNGRGPWWNAGASHLHAAFPKSWFDTLGRVSLLDTGQRLPRTS